MTIGKQVSRRSLMQTTAAAAAVAYFPWTAKAFENDSKNDRPLIGGIGLGGMGRGDCRGHANFGDIVAIAAEDYHQDYYKKNKLKYKYYRYRSGRDAFIDKAWGDQRDYKPMPLESSTAFIKPSKVELETTLTPLQFRVTQTDGTEPPFKNEFWDNKEPGIYVDVVSGEPLFSSLDKYKSGTGWPSFTKPLVAKNVVETTDYKLIWPRTEVRSKNADSHLGHVFNDGPKPTGLRYCLNSAALRFVPTDELEKDGYGEFVTQFE